MTTDNSRAVKIAALNDAFRKQCSPLTEPPGGQLVITQGVNALGGDAIVKILEVVAGFNDFNDGNDPHGEHDFGAIEFEGEKIFWKFDYFDLRMKFGSEDPSDPSQTTRVLTIMLAEEY